MYLKPRSNGLNICLSISQHLLRADAWEYEINKYAQTAIKLKSHHISEYSVLTTDVRIKCKLIDGHVGSICNRH